MADREPLNLAIPPDHAQALRQAVDDGEYRSVEEALADALSTWMHRHEDRAEELAWVKAKIRASLLDPRPSLSMEEVRAHMNEVYKRAARQDDAAA